MPMCLPKIKDFFKSGKGLCLSFLTLVFLALVLTNFPWGKWFLGWDNLVPELNFSANLKNGIFGLWQENEGLGLVGGHGYAATVPQTAFLWLLSWLIPIQYLRPIFHLLMVYLGALGCFFLAGRVQRKENFQISLISSLFYLLNFGTVQMFYIPLEAFSVHFAALPWLFYLAIGLFSDFSQRKIFLFLLVSFLFSVQGFIPQLFLIYFLSLGLLCLALFLARRKIADLKKGLIILFLTLIANAYWLAPFTHYFLTNSDIYLNSYNNLRTTADFVSNSEKFGNMEDLTMVRGFVYGAIDTLTGRGVFYIFQPWRDHFGILAIKIIYFTFFSLAVLGVLTAFKKGLAVQKAFAFIFFVAFAFLASGFFPFSVISNILRNNLPLFKQAFRIAFTKVSIVYSLSYSLMIGAGMELIFNFIKRLGEKGALYFGKAVTVLFIILIIFVSWPVFKGNFFYDKIRLDLPKEYLQVFDFFKGQKESSRIANFPQTGSTGWTFYKWGYSGSGFLWYGLNQPIMDRNFDVWSDYNENYYWEISYALYSKNNELFEKVLEKYQINWLLVDENVINPGAPKAIFLDELEEMVGGQRTEDGRRIAEDGRQKFELAATFGKIKIYKVNLETAVKDFVYLAEDLPQVNGYEWGNIDQAYNDLGDYIANNFQSNSKQSLTTNHQSPTASNVYYPFRSLFTGRSPEDLDFQIEDEGDSFIFKKNLPKGVADYELVVPPYKGDELVEVDKSDFSKVAYLIPTVEMKEGKIEVIVPKVNGLFSAEINPTQVNEVLQAKNCNQFSNGRVENKDGLWVVSRVVGVGDEEKKVLRLEAEDATNCSAAFWLPDLPNKYGYLISAETRNISGKPLLFWLENLTNRKADLEAYLTQNSKLKTEPKEGSTSYQLQATSYFIQPPMAEDGLGYSLHFDNISVGREETVNELGKISVHPIPYKFLTSLQLVEPQYLNDVSYLSELTGGVNVYHTWGDMASHLQVEHSNPAVYEIEMKQSMGGNETLVLSQAYHEGWVAYTPSSKFKVQSSKLFRIFPFFCGERLEHVKVNNWENGWKIGSKFKVQSSKLAGEETTIILVFWPQYWEWLGLALMIVGLVLVWNNTSL